MDRTPQPVLRVDDIHKDFGRRSKRKKVLKGLSFEVPENRVVSLLDVNGAGKTILVSVASTLILPTSGTIEVCGTNVVTHPEQARRPISLTGQFAAIDGELTGRENLIFFARLYGLRSKAVRARTDELLEQFRLSAAAIQRAARYSGSMRRRLDIVASLITEPRLLFLDEPTTRLDPLLRRGLWETIENL